MIRKTISYKDFNGEQQTDVLYFHLSKAELGRIQMRRNGKFIGYLQDAIERKEIEDVYDFFYNLLLDSYGEKDASGKKFNKNKQMRDDFENSIPFSEILMEIIASPDKMSEFTKGVLPEDMVTKAGEIDVGAIPAQSGVVEL